MRILPDFAVFTGMHREDNRYPMIKSGQTTYPGGVL